MKLKDIKPNPNNPRVIRDDKFEKLRNSIESFPQMMALRPIVVDADNVILGGNMRFRALQDLGYKEIPDEWVKKADELTEEQKREFIIKDNSGFGSWDWDALANEWDAEQLSEWGLDMPDDWAGGGEQKGASEGDWSDDGAADISQYGVIVICVDTVEQEKVFNWLSAEGYKCKIVVT